MAGGRASRGYRALNESADQILQIVTEELLPIMTAYGWFF